MEENNNSMSLHSNTNHSLRAAGSTSEGPFGLSGRNSNASTSGNLANVLKGRLSGSSANKDTTSQVLDSGVAVDALPSVFHVLRNTDVNEGLSGSTRSEFKSNNRLGETGFCLELMSINNLT